MIVLKNLEHIEKIRKSCKLVATGLSQLSKMAKPGVTTMELDTWAEQYCYDHGAEPAFKGYKKYPYTLCTSVNSEIVHGMPRKSPLIRGDILSIDFGVLLDGFYGDSAITIPIGNVKKETKRLIKIGEDCLYLAIGQAYKGNRLNNISWAIQSFAEKNGYSTVRKFVGHGIGAELHEDPQIPNHTDKPGEGIELKSGMVLAIEPMLMEGDFKSTTRRNGWTSITADGGLAVHWEHTVLITDEGVEVLTSRKKGKEFYGKPKL